MFRGCRIIIMQGCGHINRQLPHRGYSKGTRLLPGTEFRAFVRSPVLLVRCCGEVPRAPGDEVL